ncbi:MAG TPA: hypothetical protein VHY20_10755 [Pirellulales bacterium]|nr:hypothetical protein [Pirellulales bacterium]
MSRHVPSRLSRRQMLHAAAGAAGVWAGASRLYGHADSKRPKVAAIFTELRFKSHAYHIVECCLGPYLFNGGLVEPGCELVSFYADQFPAGDLARAVSARYQVPLYKTIDEALCLGGTELAVDAVLLIGEHGDYPTNELGQHLYPRKQFFDQAMQVMQRSNRHVPLFNDKHLSYRWDWAQEMYDTARRHGMPLVAGSSVSLAERRPPLDLPAGARIQAALAVHGGGMESYGFHGLELLQSFVEARRGGETGIRQVELLSGDALQKAADAGRWSRELFQAAMDAERNIGVRRRTEILPPSTKPTTPEPADDLRRINHGILVTYRDGLQAAVLQVGGSANRWNFACQLAGESQPRATALFNGPWGNRCLFRALSHAIQCAFCTGREPYPVERTLLTSGALEAAMRSHAAGKPIDTPQLEVAYQPVDFSAFREHGATWKLITADTPEPLEFAPGGDRQYLVSK